MADKTPTIGRYEFTADEEKAMRAARRDSNKQLGSPSGVQNQFTSLYAPTVTPAPMSPKWENHPGGAQIDDRREEGWGPKLSAMISGYSPEQWKQMILHPLEPAPNYWDL